MLKRKLKKQIIKADTDVLIIGAGISGIGSACHLTRNCPNKSYKILERRQNIGGTWDLFRYPGVRSDSDMSTFGFNFKPWKEESMLAGGEQIRDYLIETSEEYQVTKNIDFGCKVTAQKWCSKSQLWTVYYEDEQTGKQHHITATFIIGCTGYYSYDTAYTPDFTGKDDFAGDIIHPQFWPEGYDYTDKKIVIIGSGATAVTLVPSMAKKAKKVTMLQRSPTYIFSVPAQDVISAKLRGKISDLSIYRFARVRNVAVQLSGFKLAKRYPKAIGSFLRFSVKKQLNKDIDMAHFTPNYKPWDQRLCAVPDGDLFQAINSDKADVVTDGIDRFTQTGIQLQSGKHLDADVIITATGLTLQFGGGSETYIDEQQLNINKKMTYRGVLVEGIPNSAVIFGYINSSWTLKADISSQYICRLLNHMEKKGYTQVIPKDSGNNRTEQTFFGEMKSGYIQRAIDNLPRQGKAAPWKVTNNLLKDIRALRFSRVKDDALEFRKPKR